MHSQFGIPLLLLGPLRLGREALLLSMVQAYSANLSTVWGPHAASTSAKTRINNSAYVNSLPAHLTLLAPVQAPNKSDNRLPEQKLSVQQHAVLDFYYPLAEYVQHSGCL